MTTKRSHQPSSSNEPSKKVRFDARNPSVLAAEEDEEDDAVLAMDTIGKGAGPKKSAVNLDGFDSDSSEDNFDLKAAERARENAKAKKIEDEDDKDMFGDSDDEDENEDNNPDLAVKRKKTVNFIDAQDIEGQILSSTGGSKSFDLKDAKGNVDESDGDSDSDSDSDNASDSNGHKGEDQKPGDTDEEVGAGSKKKHAPKFEAFNLREEAEEGKYDETGHYVRQIDPNAIHDSWLQGISKRDMKKAKDAEEQRQQERIKKDREHDLLMTSDLIATLIQNLEKGESILEALQRLNKSKLKSKHKMRHNKGRDKMDVDDDDDNDNVDEKERKRKQCVDEITGAADALLTRGQEHIYEAERELLMRQYKRETGEDWIDSASTGKTGKWLFKWADARDSGLLHGPYDLPTIKSWIEAGYFGGNVVFQQEGEDEWISSFD